MQTQTAKEAKPAFVGWIRRPGGSWRQATAAADWFRCWEQLLLAGPQMGHADKVVLAAGQHPDAKETAPCRAQRR